MCFRLAVPKSCSVCLSGSKTWGGSAALPVRSILFNFAKHCLHYAVYSCMNLYFQKVKKTYRPLATYTREAKNGEAGTFTADLDSAEEV